MLLPITLLVVLLAAPMPGSKPGPAPVFIAAVPDEPGVAILPAASIFQTVAADLDDDGRRELIRLVRGDGDAVLAEVWGRQPAGWHLRGEPVEVVPASRIGTRIDPVYQSTPVRLLVRVVEDAEHVTVVTQPHFEQIDVGPPCCLLLHDLVIEDGSALRRAVSGPGDFADAIIVIDLDGDETDELLSTRSLPPAGDISFPIEARVHRWADGTFAEPTVTRLPVGSGDAPFRLGDSDGVAGDEAGIISSLGRPGIFRIRLSDNDEVALDDGGVVADHAVAVPVDGGRGVAVVGSVGGLRVAAWPPGEPISEPIAESGITDGRIVGTVNVRGQPKLVVHEPAADAVHLLSLPNLLPPQGISITRSPAAAALAGAAVAPFSGPLPGGGVEGEPSLIHAGRLIPSTADAGSSGTSLMATLAGAEPIGLLGDGDLIAIQHGMVGRLAPRPDGGALVVPTLMDGAWTSITPLAVTLQPEAEDGDLAPPLRGAVRVDAREGIAVGRGGFRAEVTAPPGSRVVVADFDPSVIRAAIIVPASGMVDAPFVPPPVTTANPRFRATLLVLTPAGHAYLASWDVRVRTEPPPVELMVSTPFGSSAVEVEGRTTPYAKVRVDGMPVELNAGGRFATTVELPPWPTEILVEVGDGLGNATRRSVTGVGVFDYRGLPWVPITVALAALVGAVLFLRVPRSSPLARRDEDDDAILEELEPD